MSLKRILLAPAILLANVVVMFDRLRRIWAFARLQAATFYRVPRSVVILGVPEVHGTGEITLGENLFLYRDLYLETRGPGQIDIADDVVVSRGVHIVSAAGISIGEGSMIGEYTSIRDANHVFGAGIAPRDAGHNAASIRIGRHVWIGRGVTILPGVSIGDYAVVGANAVVTRDIPACTTAAGVPARVIERKVQAVA